MKAIVFEAFGGPEVLQLVDLDVGTPGPGEARVKHTAIGVNFIDTYHRTGLYPVPLPSGLGVEAAGIVEAVGDGVTHVSVGDRVVYFSSTPGGYATHRVMSAHWLVRLPEGISDDVAAAVWLKACTVEFLVERCAHVQAGDAVLVQAAAGGVGILLCQWLKAIGATVIGTVGSPDKIETARGAGADHVLTYAEVPGRVRQLTEGKGVSCVIDGVGKATFEGSLDALCKRGLHISYGNASGPIGPVDFGILARKGSLYTTRPTLFDYYATASDFAVGSARVLQMLERKAISPTIGQVYDLQDARKTHEDLESRRTIGSSLLKI